MIENDFQNQFSDEWVHILPGAAAPGSQHERQFELGQAWMGKALMREEILATIPQQQSDSILEIVLVSPENNRSCVELRQLVWGPGLGWYRQHTLTVEATAAHALLRGFNQLRKRLGAHESLGQENKVIPLQRGHALRDATR